MSTNRTPGSSLNFTNLTKRKHSPACYCCFEKSSKIQCTSCNSAFYCSTTCQDKDTEFHKVIYQGSSDFQKQNPKPVSHLGILLPNHELVPKFVWLRFHRHEDQTGAWEQPDTPEYIPRSQLHGGKNVKSIGDMREFCHAKFSKARVDRSATLSIFKGASKTIVDQLGLELQFYAYDSGITYSSGLSEHKDEQGNPWCYSTNYEICNLLVEADPELTGMG
ncbi:uncharacterized protein LY89DRAFT_721059 [Mollisia scopiformis]|uniref:MYND-type domain-containing protein n=1 Tax=Mollisia scopiformis TaxID=149040 RepID=A0A194X0Z5_MOLSC|nr:uncharacterized protein LY89DRAFT_721059 [Mollisia scopiformis]KUJ13865.1 hypothetical protein LY89DRAFT_721059 [Mollisia scopiformis]